MGKKAKKREAAWRACGYDGVPPWAGTAMPPPWAAAQAAAPAAAPAGVMSGVSAWLRGLPAQQQFLLGLALGAGAVWLLGDEQRRAAILRSGMKLYSGVAGGFEELKEQMADLKAEMDARQQDAP